jgi:DNA-binding NarL/FixJ family response regulator
MDSPQTTPYMPKPSAEPADDAMVSEPTHLLIVDDDAFNREGLRVYFELHGYRIVEAADAAGAIARSRDTRLCAAIVDISIPPDASRRVQPDDAHGLDVAHLLKNEQPALGVVIFSAFEHRGDDVTRMIRAGVRGLAYKLKGCPPADLLAAVRDAQAGHVIIDAGVTGSRAKVLAAELIKQLSPDERDPVCYAIDSLGSLTPREHDIAYRIAASQTIKGVAAELYLAPKSVENAITTIYSKLGLNTLQAHLREVVILAKACLIHDLQHR